MYSWSNQIVTNQMVTPLSLHCCMLNVLFVIVIISTTRNSYPIQSILTNQQLLHS